VFLSQATVKFLFDFGEFVVDIFDFPFFDACGFVVFLLCEFLLLGLKGWNFLFQLLAFLLQSAD
jgi:hypothetical protein